MNPGWQPVRARLSDGRWHFQQGPIDLVIGADGDPAACEAAHEACWARFAPVLGTLVGELSVLRSALPPVGHPPEVTGPVAKRMLAACLPHARQGLFITAMAAVGHAPITLFSTVAIAGAIPQGAGGAPQSFVPSLNL